MYANTTMGKRWKGSFPEFYTVKYIVFMDAP